MVGFVVGVVLAGTESEEVIFMREGVWVDEVVDVDLLEFGLGACHLCRL